MKKLFFLVTFLMIAIVGFCQKTTTPVHNVKGDEYLKAGDTINAISEYSKTIELTPKNYYALKMRGVLNSASGEYEVAIKDFSECILIKQDDADIYFQRGLARQKTAGNPGVLSFSADPFSGTMTPEKSGNNVWTEILNDYKEAIRINPSLVDAYYHTAIIKNSRMLGDMGDPLEDFNAVIRLQPGNTEILNLRGVYKAKKKDYQGAEADFDSVLTILPGDTITLQNIISTKIYLEKHEEALKYCEQFISESKNKGTGYFTRGVCKSYSKDFPGCVEDFDKAISISPNESVYYLYRGYFKITELKAVVEGCKDLNMAQQLGDNQAKDFLNQYCK
jgi:tetratricopeptide (TPR) repeat protein